MASKKRGGLREWIKAFVIAFLILWVLKLVCYESYTQIGTTMEKSYYPGDYIILNKLYYGSRMPKTILSFPFVREWYFRFPQFPYLRIPGYSTLKINDLIVFNYPMESDLPVDKKEICMKRIIALPGDSLRIERKEVFVNGKRLEPIPTVQHNYRVTANNGKFARDFYKDYSLTEGGLIDPHGLYDFPLTSEMAQKMRVDKRVRAIHELLKMDLEGELNVFPENKFYSWNKDYFGLLVIPFEGMTIPLNDYTYPIYRRIIEVYENNTTEIQGKQVIINGRFTRQYTFKQDYYFVLDDNRDNSKDSRNWGFVPEDHIIGKATVVLFSYDNVNHKIRWNRWFKPAH